MRLEHAGKVRDVYDAGPERLLLVASDRLSAFDVVLPEPVPDKGRVLTATSAFWFRHLHDVPSHLLAVDGPEVPPEHAGRAMLVRRCRMLTVECVVRGFITGSAWKEYATSGTVHGARLPSGLRQADELPEAIFTPTTKAPVGVHDEPLTFDEVVALVGPQRGEEARTLALEVYRRMRAHAESRGFLLADTKLELGVPYDSPSDGPLVLADEVGTPDSSRFWLTSDWSPGSTPPGFDKQPVRDWLESSGWDKRPPAPHLPAAVVAATRQRYVDAYERLSGLRVVPLAGRHPAVGSGGVTFSVLVEVRLRPGIADPQGATIERSLPTLGVAGVSGVTMGKAIRFTLDASTEDVARATVTDLCQRFLTNPVMEDAVVTVEKV